MNIHPHAGNSSGWTLVELLVTIGIFGILMAIIYPTFSSVNNHVSEINDKQELLQKGQRVLDYIGEEFRLAGLFVGARPSVTYCGEVNTNSLMHTPGDPADAVTLLSSERIRTETINSPYLASTVNAAQGVDTVTVNAAQSYVPDSYIVAAPGTDNNARAFITFDTLQPNLGTLVYQVTEFSGNALTLSPVLDQAINAQSNAYSVVWKRIEVVNRELRVVRRTKTCTAGAGFDIDTLIATHGPGNISGGVDGLQMEYLLANGNAVAVLAAADIVNVRAIRIWLLLRSDFPAKSFLNTTTYTLGQTGPVNVAVNDNYRRILLTKTVEVKNVGF